MSEPTTVPALPVAAAPWLLTAVVAGAAGGVIALQGVRVSGLALAAVVAACLVAVAVKRLDIGLILLLFTLPLDVYGRVLTEPIAVTVFQLMLVLTLGAWALKVVGEGASWFRLSAVDVGIGALVLAGVWSLPNSLAPSATVTAIVRVAFLWAFCLMYCNAVRDAAELRRVLGFLVGTGGAIGLLALAQYFVPGFDFGSTHDVRGLGGTVALTRAGGFFEDPNYLAGFLSVTFIAAFAMLVHARGRRAALGWGVGLGVTGLALLVTFSRTGWVGAALGCVAIALTAPRRRRVWLIAGGLAVAVAAVALAPEQIVSRTRSIGDIERDMSVATRYYMFYSTIEMIEDDWVYGTGLGAYDRAYPEYRKPGTRLAILKPHQLPLALWAEMGIAGLLAQVALIAALIVLFARRGHAGWTGPEAAALAGLLTLLVQTLFQYYLYFEYVWLFLALAVLATRLGRTEKEFAV